MSRWFLHPMTWLTLLVVGFLSPWHWLFWLGFALAAAFATTTRIAMKALSLAVTRLNKRPVQRSLNRRPSR